MSTKNKTNLKNLLQTSLPGTVCLASWLEKQGISRDLQQRYKKSGWLEAIGAGAFIKPKDQVGWEGGIYAIQQQAGTPIHPGALTAIALQGSGHYIRMGREKIHLFAPLRTILPKWFKTHEWGADIAFHPSNILLAGIGLNRFAVERFGIDISSLERAILECLYLAPKHMDVVECYQIMEGLATLRPNLLQELLENCHSVKVTRLFLYMAEKAGHAWFNYLDTSKFNVGKGDRSIVKNGVYIASHKITVPRELTTI